RFGLLGAAYAPAVMELETRTPARDQPVLPAGDENLQVLGFATAREPIQAVQLLYSGRSPVAPPRWAPADELASLTGNAARATPAGGWRYVFRASIPRADVPPEHVGLRVRIVTASLQVLESDALYSLQPSSTEPMLFPARPAPAPAQGGVQLVLLGGCLLLALLACGASGRPALVLPWLLAGVVVLSLLPFGEALAPAVPRDLFYPPSGELAAARDVRPQQRVVAMSSYSLGAEVLSAWDLPDARGYDALTPP